MLIQANPFAAAVLAAGHGSIVPQPPEELQTDIEYLSRQRVSRRRIHDGDDSTRSCCSAVNWANCSADMRETPQ